MKLNKSYPFTILTTEHETISTTGYAVDGTVPTISKNTNNSFPFEKLDYDTEGDYNFGVISYLTANNEPTTSTIDMIINKSVLTKYANIINSQKATTEITNTVGYANYIEKVTTEYNFYDILKYYTQMNLLHDNIVKKYSDTESKYYQLYNDKDGDNYYAEQIWRAQPKVDIKLTSGKLDKNIPLFTCVTSDNDIKFYIRIRNFNIPMKRVLTGSKENSSKENEYHYIFIYPEYIFKQYSNYSDVIQYIYTTSAAQDISSLKYEGSRDADWSTVENKYDYVGNTQLANLS